MKKKWMGVLASVLAFSFLLGGCGGKPIISEPGDLSSSAGGSEASSDAGAAAPAGEKVIAVSLPKAWDSMMPLNTNNNYSRFVYDQIYDRLIMENADGSYAPRLATSWTVNEDSTAVTFKLAENVKWQDGTPFTADDVVFSFQLYSDPKVEALSRYYLQYIDGVDESGAELSEDSINVKANGANEITITMKKPMYADTLLSNLNMVFMIPKHIFAGKTTEEINAPDLWAKPVGTGPFKYDSEISGERMELVKNPDYFQGAPDIDKLVVRVVDNTSLVANLMSGDVDINVQGSIPMQDWAMAKEQENLTAVSFPTTSYYTFIMNMSKPYMTEKVRNAFSMAISRDVLVNSLLQGEGEAIVTPFCKLSPYYNDKVEVWYDPEQAKQILTEENFPFDQTLQYYTASGSDNERIAALITQDLEKLGVKVQITQVDFPTLMNNMREGVHDFGFIGSGGTMDPSESREMIAPGSSVNFAQVPDNSLADMVDKANDALTFEERKPLFDAYQEKIKEVSPMAYLYTRNTLLAQSKRLSNVNTDNFGTLNWSIWTWKVEA